MQIESHKEMHNSTKTGEYRCTGAHSTKKWVVGVVEATGVSHVIKYIEINYRIAKTSERLNAIHNYMKVKTSISMVFGQVS